MFKLGNYVQDNVHGNKGRIYQKHHNFKDTGESAAWLAGLVPQVSAQDVKSNWYSVLCKDGGAIAVPESRLFKIEKIKLNNVWESHYFEDAE